MRKSDQQRDRRQARGLTKRQALKRYRLVWGRHAQKHGPTFWQRFESGNVGPIRLQLDDDIPF